MTLLLLACASPEHGAADHLGGPTGHDEEVLRPLLASDPDFAATFERAKQAKAALTGG